MMRRIFTLLALLVLLTGMASAQELVYFEGDLRVYEDVNGDLFELQDSIDGNLYFGYELDTNYVVKTLDGFAEVILPNGHVLKLGEDTQIRLDSIASRGSSSGDDVVSVAAGRLRSVVANLTGTSRGFRVNTPTAVGGVRGTDFVTLVADGIETIAVKEGLVAFADKAGNQIELAANQFANALGSTFSPQSAGNIIEQFYGALEKLSEQAEQSQQAILAQLAPPADEPVDEPDEPADEPDGSDDESGEDETEEGTPETTTTDAVIVDPVDESAGDDDPSDTPDGSDEPGPMDDFMAGIMEALGIEIGTITLEGSTYSKVVAKPEFQLGKLRAGLYLPVIYEGNMFEPDDWYKPKGNNEWSFGFDQDQSGEPLENAWAFTTDFVGDLALKIKYLEWGSQRDPFFVKVGNLNTMTLGHGLLMRNYANDTEFPAVRRVGLSTGLDFGTVGFEALTNDLADPSIFGARLYLRPIKSLPIAVGLSGLTDIGPARDLPSGTGDTFFDNAIAADPIFVNLAIDLDYPIINRPAMGLIAYADFGGLVPYLRNPVGGLDAGMQWQALVENTDSLVVRNYGIAAGLEGNASIFRYRLEFQDFHGVFQPAFYDANYDRIRGDKAVDTMRFLDDMNASEYQNETIGIFGEAGVTFADLVSIDAGYRWPFTRNPDTNQIETGDDDFLHASLTFQEGLLPLGISASLSYERNQFLSTVRSLGDVEGISLFDANTVMSGGITYPVAPIMDIVASVSVQILRDADGNVQYEDVGGTLRPKYGPVVSIQTVLGGSEF